VIGREFMAIQDKEVTRLQVGTLKLEIHPTRKAAGEAAAQAVARAIRQFGASGKDVAVIFAAAASQIATLRELTAMPDISWKRILGFHMDSYADLPEDHPASFLHFLRQNLTQKVAMKEFFGIDGNAPDPELACRDYAQKLRSAQPQLCLAGIGENGHLAFNDPPEADFNDPLDVKIVQLDDVTRRQQVAEGWFKSLEDVPTAAITLTVPALLRVQTIIASVPGSRKAEIIRRVVEEPISTNCPATILRTHPDASVYLDTESAAQLDPRTLASAAL
jgi:glucosamine-6-phosphate deaminase